MIPALVLTALLAQSGGYYSPAEAKSLFDQANEAHARGDDATARDLYLRLVDHQLGGPDVLYNLGTSALAQGDLGHAVLYLERARREGGTGADLEANLQLARSRQIDEVVGGETETPFLPRLVEATAGNAIAIAFLVCWVLGFAGVIAFRFLPPGRRTWVAVAAGLLFVAAVPFGALLAAHAWFEANVREAVVLEKTVAARDVPSESAKTSFEIHEGLKVRVLEDSGKYLRIRLPNGREGWAPKDAVAAL